VVPIPIATAVPATAESVEVVRAVGDGNCDDDGAP
jgi:hypothetical protein